MIANPLCGLNLFDLSRFFIVFGFALAIICGTNRLIDFKSPRPKNRKNLRRIGIISIVAGVFVVWTGSSLSLLRDAAVAIKGIGADVIGLGCSCIIQAKFTKEKQQQYLMWGAYGAVGLGFIIAILAILAEIFKWF